MFVLIGIILLSICMPYLVACVHSVYIKNDFMNYNVTMQGKSDL